MLFIRLSPHQLKSHSWVVRSASTSRLAAGTWTICDLGSTNGVRVNGRQIEGTEPLRSGDRIALGTAEISFVLE